MELIVFGFLCLLIFAVYPAFKSHVSNPKTLPDLEIEQAWVSLKRKIISNSSFENPTAYSYIYDRAVKLVKAIQERHEALFFGYEARCDNHLVEFSLIFKVSSLSDMYSSRKIWEIPYNLEFSSFDSDKIIYLSFISYHGCMIKNFGQVINSDDFLFKSVDYLINERDYPLAYLLKGIVLKYGIHIESQTQAIEARSYLKVAASNGLFGAQQELAHLDLHEKLDELGSINIGNKVWP